MNFSNFFLFLYVIFALQDPDPDPKRWNTDKANKDFAKIWLLFYSRGCKVRGGWVVFSDYLLLLLFLLLLLTGEQDNAVGGGVAAGADGVRAPALLRDRPLLLPCRFRRRPSTLHRRSYRGQFLNGYCCIKYQISPLLFGWHFFSFKIYSKQTVSAALSFRA